VEVATLSEIDLNDPDILGAALSKASTVARSLKTTTGRVLDISASGQVAASLNDIASNADNYRAVFAAKEFTKVPRQLGVLSQWNAEGLDQVKPWENNRLPTYNEAVVLKPESIKQIESGKHFKLDARSKDLLRDRIDLKSLEMKSVQPR
jgi:hypothetical protein